MPPKNNGAINPKQIIINTKQGKTNTENFLYRQVSFWLSVMGIAFAAFIYLSAPAKDNDTAIQLQAQQIAEQKETITTITKTQQNDTQEVKKALENTNTQLQLQSNEITKLSTIIEERIPKINK